MRKQRDGEDTKERVLSAAKKLFAENGFSGTSLAMISQESGISDGLILHHFQSKKNLYHQVLEDLAGRYAQELQPSGTPGMAPEEMMVQTLKAHSISGNRIRPITAYRCGLIWSDKQSWPKKRLA